MSETYVDIPTDKAVSVMAAMTRYCKGEADLTELRQARDVLSREIGRALNDGRAGVREMAPGRDTRSMEPAGAGGGK